MTGRKQIGRLAAAVDESARAAGLWPGREPLLVAVSGGADSVALLELLGEIRSGPDPDLAVIHLDHCLRPSSSADARWVEKLAEARGYPYFGGRRDCRALAASAGLSLEDACRRARHDFFRRAAERFSGAPVVLAHHADDQAETVLMRFLLGASPSGLAGMLPLRRFPGITLLRPLLDVPRRELIEYLRRRGVTWREDESNRDPAFFRNRLRHELLPLLEREYAPGLSRRLVHLARLEADRDDWIDAAVSRLRDRIAFRRGPVVGLRLSELDPLAPAARRFLLREAAAAAGTGRMDRAAWERFSRLAEGRTRSAAELPGGVAVRVGKGVLWLIPPFPAAVAGEELALTVPGRVVVHGLRISSRELASAPDPATLPAPDPEAFWTGPGSASSRAYFPTSGLAFPLSLRPRKPGERYRPLGAGGRRRLKEVMVDAGVPLPFRELPVVLADGEGVVWIPGGRVASRFALPAPGPFVEIEARWE